MIIKLISETYHFYHLMFILCEVACLWNYYCSKYDPTIIERTIGLVLGHFTALCRSFLKCCTLNNKAVGTI